MSADAHPHSVEELYLLHSSWRTQLESSHAALLLAHQRCAELVAVRDSSEAFSSSLFAVERRALLEQLQSLCRDKLSLKKQIADMRRDKVRPHTSPHTHTTDSTPSSHSHPADNGAVLPSPPSSISATSAPLSFPSSAAFHPSTTPSSSADLLLRSEVDDLRSQVHRLRADRQSLSSLLHQREAELDDAERTISRLTRERERLQERMREMEEKAMAQLEANAAMQEVLRRALEKERAWMEERADIEREMERMGSSSDVGHRGRPERRVSSSAYGQLAADQHHALHGRPRTDSLDTDDSDEASYEPTDTDDGLE